MARKPITPLAERARKLVLLLVVVLVLIIGQVWLWRFVYDQTLAYRETRSRDQQVNEAKSRAAILTDNYARHKILLEQLSAVVPKERDTLQLIDRLEALAGQGDLAVQISDITEQFDEAEPAGDKEEKDEQALAARGVFPLLVRVTVRGPVIEIMQYIDGVEYLPELTRIKSFKITPMSGALDPGTFSADVDILFYLQRG